MELSNIMLYSFVSFLAGILFMGLAIATTTVCMNQEPGDDLSILFKRGDSNNEADEFNEFIIDRMATSQPFRLKVVDGLVRLYRTDREAYMTVMRKQ